MNDALKGENRRLSRKLAAVALAMFGFGFAMVPFYNQICQALGIYTLVQKSELPANTQVDASRTVIIEFDSNTRDLPWSFKPVVSHLEVHPGEVATVEYEVINVRGAPAAQKQWEGADSIDWTHLPTPAPYHTFETPPVIK